MKESNENKEKLLSGSYIEAEIENSKFGPICNEKDQNMSWKFKITPLCDLYWGRNRTFRILANLLWNRDQNTCDLHRGKNWKLQIWVSLICNIAQNANKVKITPLCDVHRGRNRKFEIWFNWFWKRARNEMKIRNHPCMWFT